LSYNAEMGISGKSGGRSEDHQVDAWLRDGGIVIAASERARRALTARYHHARRSEGLSAWPAPEILDWQTFLRSQWELRAATGNTSDRMMLGPAQEKAIWAELAGTEQRLATLLTGPRNRVASLAMQAHQLLCLYAPQFLRAAARNGWQQDAGIFSGWLTVFDEKCEAGHLLSSARLPLELIALLENEASRSVRPPLLLAGFDRILPVQQRLLDAWGTWQSLKLDGIAEDVRLYRAADGQQELAACALWCRQKLEVDGNAKLLVISQELAQRRGEFERAFLSLTAGAESSPTFEFSLGIPLGKVAIPRGAFLLLRWLTSQLEENELDWLFSSGLAAADDQESTALQSYMRTLRRRNLERPEWSLKAFLSEQADALPSSWTNRMLGAQRRLVEQVRTRKSPLEWAEFIPGLLQTMGWPGARPLSSEEFQVVRRWELALESCASLGFDGRRISWSEFLLALADALEETLFAPESREAPIQIAGPAESAGLTADAIWFMGASEDAWPAAGATHPLLPLEVQRDAAMPHATSQLDWELSHSIISRLLASAPVVRFSYARQTADAESRPSRMIVRAAGEPFELPPDLTLPPAQNPATVTFDDFSQIPFPSHAVAGGASVLTHQSQCPFKAFASARLGAQGWNAAEPCLTAAQRGQLLHAVLHSVWGGAETGGIRTLRELKSIADRTAFVAAHVSQASQSALNRSVCERLPQRYLEMEERRLTSLIGEWLEYELARVEFAVVETEAKRNVPVAGLQFDLRLDRIDRLSDGTLLVIDYKTGQVTPKAWELPWPDDVQLPLYASFALRKDETLGGLAFAKVRRGDSMGFAGHIKDAAATLNPSLRGTSSLVKNKLDDEMLAEWKQKIVELANDFLAGCADVDPREYPETCERCGLQTLCRIQEHRVAFIDDESGDTDAEAADE
jgi:ATP-dependent helicase/nuclease subunit B